MSLNVDKDTLNKLREEYPAGSRVELTKMNDPYRPDLVPGTRGTVQAVDDSGTIHVNWDCGSSLEVVYGEDACKKLDSVKTICYGEENFWDTRKEALEFFKEGILMSEGSEQQRYIHVCMDLMEGKTVCTDGEEPLRKPSLDSTLKNAAERSVQSDAGKAAPSKDDLAK